MKLAWSSIAKDELKELRRFSVERWGHDVTRRYLEDIRVAADFVCEDPRRARKLRGPFRILRVRSHYLILHLDPAVDRLTVTRVLHSAMDIERHLP